MISKYFKLEEIVPRAGGDLSMFHPDYPAFLDEIREIVGPLTINTHHKGGTRQWSGVRFPGCPQWKPGSRHSYIEATGKRCEAFDAIPHDMTASEARALLVAKAPSLLGRLEDGVSWLHCDMGPRKDGRVHLFEP